VKAQAAERENLKCGKCRTYKVRMLQEELQNALRQIDQLKARNKRLDEELLLAVAGKRNTVHAKQKVVTCKMLSDSVLRNVGTEHADMVVDCFPGIKTEQLHRVKEEDSRYSRNYYYSGGY
jgi:hypothetical protein